MRNINNANMKRLTSSKPFYAAAGAGEFAVEQLRTVPERLRDVQTRLQGAPDRIQSAQSRLQSGQSPLQDVRSQVQGRLQDAQGRLQQAQGRLQGVRLDRRELQQRATEYANTLSERANGVYDDLAKRGESVVSRTREGGPVRAFRVPVESGPTKPASKPEPASKSEPAGGTRSTTSSRRTSSTTARRGTTRRS